MSQPKCWIIAEVNPRSRNYVSSQRSVNQTLTLAQQWGWSVDVWPAVDGWTMSDQQWDDIGVTLLNRGAILRRPGARGCFHSHFGIWLWAMKHQQSVVVLEHDAAIRGPWPEDLDIEHCVWKLHRPDGRGDRVNDYTGLWSCGAWAYTLTDKFAGQLVDFSRSVGAQAVDKQLGDRVVPWNYWRENLVVHSPRANSTTSPMTQNAITITKSI